MTLSHFLRDYLYIPLGGRERRYLALMLTMLLGGLWHGAGWQFLLWGGLHGGALCLAHGWKTYAPWRWPGWLSLPLTLGFVMLAWIPFRADSLATSLHLFQALHEPWHSVQLASEYADLLLILVPGLAIALLLPNSQRWVARWQQAMESTDAQRARQALFKVGLLCGIVIFAVLKALYAQPGQAFLYFDF